MTYWLELLLKQQTKAADKNEPEPDHIGEWMAPGVWGCNCWLGLGVLQHWADEAECPDCGWKRPPEVDDDPA